MRYHNITKDDMLNGDGLRVVLWVAGCSHCCRECHNPITWDPAGGLPFDEAAKEEIFAQLDKMYISGITFSGGDPLHSANRLEVRNLMAEIKERYPNKTIWLYTGDVWENILHYPLMQYVDVVVDGEFQVEKKDAKLLWKGSSNQRVIDVQASLKQPDPLKPILHCGDYARAQELCSELSHRPETERRPALGSSQGYPKNTTPGTTGDAIQSGEIPAGPRCDMR